MARMVGTTFASIHSIAAATASRTPSNTATVTSRMVGQCRLNVSTTSVARGTTSVRMNTVRSVSTGSMATDIPSAAFSTVRFSRSN